MKLQVLNNHVSVVVPAYNAAPTLDETLASLEAQTFPSWEAIIVDDGSTDNTSAIATHWVNHDSRFRLVRQTNGGESAARNTGIREAKNPWLVYLDSDDWLAPDYLELMIDQVIANPRLDAVVCGCVRVTPSGQHSAPALYEPASLVDPFPDFAVDCPFAIHNCMVRRSLIAEIGDFDTGLVTCADWDFWQRVARSGTRFGTVPKVLAYYRIRPGSSSTRAERVLLDGFNVIRRGHAPDPRVANPQSNYANGLPLNELPQALFRHALWPASLMLGQGKDARPLLRLMGEERVPQLDPLQVAQNLYDSIPLAATVSPADWPQLWPIVAERLDTYLVALEVQSQAVDLAHRSVRHLERLILESMDLSQPLAIGSAYGVFIDIEQQITDVIVPEGVEHLHCVVRVAGQNIGSVHLPATGRVVANKAIAEAIETDLAWSLLLWYFRLGLPSDSQLRTRLYWLVKKTRPAYMVRQVPGLTWALFLWQFRDGLLRSPRLLARFFWLVLKMRPLRFAFQLIRTRQESLQSQVEQFLTAMARQFVREERLIIISTPEELLQTRVQRDGYFSQF